MLERPVGDRADRRAARDEVARRELAHLARADEEDALPGELLEHLLCERSAGGGDGGRALGDRRLDPDPPADVQGLAAEAVEERARRAAFVGRAHLAEDLALAGHERVEACRDAEEMQGGRLVAQAVEDAGELGGAVAGQLGQRRDGSVLRVVFAGEVELGAVAGREHHALLAQTGGELGCSRRLERDTLAQLDRRCVMRDADERSAS